MMDIDSLVNKILVKNAAKYPPIVISTLKSYGLDAVYISNNTYKITRRHELHYQAQDAARKTKKFLLHKCPELHIKNIKTYTERFRSIVIFKLIDEDSRR